MAAKLRGHFQGAAKRLRSQPHIPLSQILQGPDVPLHQARGEPESLVPSTNTRSLLKPLALMTLHPFAPVLTRWETGVPVDCGPPWTHAAVEAAVARGAHPSATTPDAIQLVHDNVACQVKAGFLQIVEWSDL